MKYILLLSVLLFASVAQADTITMVEDELLSNSVLPFMYGVAYDLSFQILEYQTPDSSLDLTVDAVLQAILVEANEGALYIGYEVTPLPWYQATYPIKTPENSSALFLIIGGVAVVAFGRRRK